MIRIIPAIDIIDGRCVRLSQGEYDSRKVYDASPLDMAKSYADCGVKRIHLVDLDGAKCSAPVNLRTLEAIASAVDMEIEWGGGIASSQDLSSVFSAGATCAIAGSVAVRKPALFREWLRAFGPARMILGADVRGREVAVKGWLEQTSTTVDELIGSFLPDGLQNVICTDISCDGMLQGPSVELYRSLMAAFPAVGFTASGGVGSMKDIEALSEAGMPSVIVGKAIYEHRISLKDIELWSQNA